MNRSHSQDGTSLTNKRTCGAALTSALMAAAIGMSGCGGVAARAPADVRQKVERFYELAGAGRTADILREYKAEHASVEPSLARRAGLGRIIRTTEAMVTDVTGRWRLVTVSHNTEFERGHGLETFNFRVDDAGSSLLSYGIQPGKKIWCPKITVWNSQCSIEDAPKIVGSR